MDMIERVGRAIAAAENYAYDPVPYDRYARAAIAAMREPTETMVREGNATPTSHRWGQSHLSGGENAEFADSAEIYTAMIDAALPSPAIDNMDRK